MAGQGETARPWQRQGRGAGTAALWVASACALVAAVAAAPLGKYWIDRSDVHASGLSAGAYMAVQFHLAYSDAISGVGALAGGPYYCARASLSVALTTCMTSPGALDVQALVDATERFAADGDIDAVANLADDKVYILAGTRDTTVNPELGRLLQTYYRAFLNDTAIVTEFALPAGHAQITDNYGAACGATQSPYINNCAHDAAGALLAHLSKKTLAPRTASLSQNLFTFEQSEFSGTSMDTLGFVYVPTVCQQGASACSLHVAFHGCLQARGNVGSEYADHAGYNEWAEANNIIVLYPQAKPDVVLGNPNACFDWWGYAGRDYAVKSGSQMAAVWGMVERLSSGAPGLAPPTDLSASNVSDNAVSLVWRGTEEADSYSVLQDGTVVATTVRTTSHTVEPLPSGSTFVFSVVAVAATGAASPPSAAISVTTTGPPPPLSAPLNLRVTDTSATTVSLAWSAVAGATQYSVMRDGSISQNASGTAFMDQGLAPETTYVYTVRAVSDTGERGPASSSVSATTRSAFVCSTVEDSNYNHVQAGRAYTRGGNCYAIGSDDPMGLYNTFYRSILSETSPGYFIVGNCP